MIYELTLFTNYVGQVCLNRWNYLMAGTPAVVTGSFGLISAVGGVPPTLTPNQFPEGTMFERIREFLSTGVAFTACVAKAVYDVEDFYELPYVPAIQGNTTGEAMAPFVALGFRSNRTRTDIRRGTKRFVGMPESQVGDEGKLTSGAATHVADIAALMSDALTYNDEGNDLTFTPIVVSKQPYTPEGSSQTAYRYYPTLSEQMEHIAQSVLWQPYAEVRSQTSRQYGRGQ